MTAGIVSTPAGVAGLQQLGWARALSSLEIQQLSELQGDFLDEFDDNSTYPWIVTQTSLTYAPVSESVADSDWGSKLGITIQGSGGAGQGTQTATITYPQQLAYHDYEFEYVGAPSRGNFGSTNGKSAAWIWFRGTNSSNCIRIGTYDDLGAPASGAGLMMHRLVGGAVTHVTTLHTHSHHATNLDGERIRVVCQAGSCQAQEWNGSTWVDIGTAIPDDGSQGEYFGAVATGAYNFGGQYGRVSLDYLKITKL